MKWMQLLTASSLTCLLGGAALAQGPDPEVTMTLLPDEATELPEAVTREIELPGEAAEEGVTNSAEGLATANENRAEAAGNRDEALALAQENAQTGLEIAAEARERGAELGAEIADTARSGREEFARGDTEGVLPIPDDLPALPGDLPGPADRPDTPDVPDVPDVPAGP